MDTPRIPRKTARETWYSFKIAGILVTCALLKDHGDQR